MSKNSGHEQIESYYEEARYLRLERAMMREEVIIEEWKICVIFNLVDRHSSFANLDA